MRRTIALAAAALVLMSGVASGAGAAWFRCAMMDDRIQETCCCPHPGGDEPPASRVGAACCCEIQTPEPTAPAQVQADPGRAAANELASLVALAATPVGFDGPAAVLAIDRPRGEPPWPGRPILLTTRALRL